ncbi:hypothetical protein [Dysgonomonas sp. ZJ709]|uniref:hypothetical protein n=1 Tax=Dysgonomonas sp. ZJ709 TaxID=2709797 RepID=UPI0013EC7ECB|nr:hypothetical protein [Dysgonomonas sp. ZJ709]
MDLDNIKKSWQEREIKPTISEEKIQRMLDNRGKNALENLMTFEKWGLLVGLLCLPCSFIFDEDFLFFFYLASVICMLIWQTYKYKFLKKINLSKIGILDISIAITKYRKYIFAELILAILWIFIFMGSFLYLKIFKRIFAHLEETSTFNLSITLSIAIGTIFTLALTAYVLYRYIYMQNIKQIEKSIAEIKDFEQDNG